MALLLTFPDETSMQVPYITDSLTITEILHNNLEPADNTCQLSVLHSITLRNKLIANADEEVKAVVTDVSGQNVLFTGYLRHSFNFSRTQVSQPITMEITSPAFLLKKPLTQTIWHGAADATLSGVLEEIGEQLGISLTITINPDPTLNYFNATAGEDAYTVIKNLLFEYGYTFDFSKEGNFEVKALFPTLPESSSAYVNFNGNNTLNKVDLKRNERRYGGAAVSYGQLKVRQMDSTLYSPSTTAAIKQLMLYLMMSRTGTHTYIETQGTDDDWTCEIKTAAGQYLYGEQYVELNYAVEEGEFLRGKVYIVEATALKADGTEEAKLVGVSSVDSDGHNVFSFTCGLYSFTITDFESYALLTATNTGNVETSLLRLKLTGDTVAKTGTAVEVTRTGTDENYTYETKYINDVDRTVVMILNGNLNWASFPSDAGKTAARNLSVKLADYFRTSLFTATVQSKVDADIGDYVTLTNPEFGQIKGRIVKKTTKRTGFAYEIESLEDYTPATPENRITRRPMTQAAYQDAARIESAKYRQHAVYCDNISTGANYSTTESRRYVGLYCDTLKEPAATFAEASEKEGIVWSRIEGIDGGYQDYKFLVGAWDLTEAQLRERTDWQDAPPDVTAQAPCLYMATKFIGTRT